MDSLPDRPSDSSSLNKLDESDVAHLISGQVILDLKNAVKELVENALDANAQSITVQFKNYGLDGVIVTDDGVGIAKEDFDSLCNHHTTGKITNFDDIQNIRGFGFRGEALASLAVLGNLKIHTATEYDQVGHYIEYDQHGRLKSIVPKARRKGTTVELQNLFCNLPVRGKELQRNISKEYGKTIDLLYSYGILAVSVKLVVLKDSVVVFQTMGTRNQIDTICSLFGSKYFKTLIPFSWSKDGDATVSASGYISKPLSNCGKSSSERQYFYINGRPCDLPNLARRINSVYHEFVQGKYPSIIIYILLENWNFDVNLAPDKRTILMNEEDIIFSWIKEQILELYAPFRQSEHIYGTDSLSMVSSFSFSSQPNMNTVSDNDSLPTFSFNLESDDNTQGSSGLAGSVGVNSDCVASSDVINSNNFVEKSTIAQSKDVRNLQVFNLGYLQDFKHSNAQNPKNLVEIKKPLSQSNLKALFGFEGISAVKTESSNTNPQPKKKQKSLSFLKSESTTKKLKRNSVFSLIQGDVKISVTIEDIISPTIPDITSNESKSKFQAEILDSTQAEAELSRFVSKQDFTRMQVLGQFNLGFIIVRLDDDLFVIDQHASDEKYTFETLMKTIHTCSQNLVNPLPIKFSSSLENSIFEYLPVIQRYGFDVMIKEDGVKSFYLIRVPMLKNLTLGVQDFEELLLKLNSGESHPIPSRIRGWYASKACRTSVMIGTALTIKKMKTIVYNLSCLDHPWNCPHGRPTMRHLHFLR